MLTNDQECTQIFYECSKIHTNAQKCLWMLINACYHHPTKYTDASRAVNKFATFFKPLLPLDDDGIGDTIINDK